MYGRIPGFTVQTVSASGADPVVGTRGHPRVALIKMIRTEKVVWGFRFNNLCRSSRCSMTHRTLVIKVQCFQRHNVPFDNYERIISFRTQVLIHLEVCDSILSALGPRYLRGADYRRVETSHNLVTKKTTMVYRKKEYAGLSA